MNHYLSVVRECLETGVSPRCHLEDIARADIYGFVVPFCIELMKLMEEYNISNAMRIFREDPEGKLRLLLEYAGKHRDIADPWYTGNFDRTYDDLTEGCAALLSHIAGSFD